MFKESVKIFRDFIGITLILASTALLCYLMFTQILEISGASMTPTLADKEHILAEKVSPKFTEFKRGEIIVFRNPNQNNILVIKRLIALPGDKIKVENGKVYVNNSGIAESYLEENSSTEGNNYLVEGQEIAVTTNHYIVMGDNRAESIDSRTWGELDRANILGRALLVYKPLKSFRVIASF